MYFDKIQGHRGVLSLLTNLLQDGKPSGVYFFRGPKSVGKYTTARHFARYILCVGTKEDSCRCESCRLFPQIPDFLEISDKEKFIKTANALYIEQFVSLVPYKSFRRVVLIDDADRLNAAASNKLLKVLEELKSNCLVILISSESEKISEMLLSRGCLVNFGPLAPEDIQNILKAQGHRLDKLGDLTRAFPYLRQGILREPSRYMEYVRYVPEFMKHLHTRPEDELLAEVQQIDEKGDLHFFVEIFLVYLNDIFKIHYDSPEAVTNVSRLDTLEELTHTWTRDLCLTAYAKLGPVIQDLRRGLNLKERPRVSSAVAWTILFMKKELAKKSVV